MIKRILSILPTLLLGACCTTNRTTVQPSIDVAGNATSTATGNYTATEDMDFWGGLFRETLLSNSTENVCISPLSAEMALTMAATGAEGETFEELIRCLQAGEDFKSDANKIVNSFKENHNDRYEARLANSIWINDRLEVKESFLDTNRDSLAAEAHSLPFNDQAVKTINSWCNEQTNGKIPTIVNALNPNDQAILINTVYFKAGWSKKFEKDATTLEPFTKDDGEVVDAMMMKQTFRTSYYEDDLVQVASKSFRMRFYMLLVLPKESVSYSDAVNHTALSLMDIKNNMETHELTLGMPRFRFSFSTSLKPVLSSMGIERAFDNRADFGGISDMPLYLSDVLQKTYISVDEEGAEAAAATGIRTGAMSMPKPAERKTMILDRPFMYAIIDNATGEVMFAGRVTEPYIGE